MDLLDPQLIIDRLKDQVTRPTLVEIGGLAELGAAASLQLTASPSAFVVPMGARPVENREGSGPLLQDFDVTVAVVIAVNLAGKRGQEALNTLKAPIAAVRAALWGWQPEGALFRFVSGDEALEDYDAGKGVALYRLDFITRVRRLEPLT